MKMTTSFDIFIGIDQTGAVAPNGRPRPLHVSIIDGRSKPRFFSALKIPSLRHEHIEKILKDCCPGFKDERVLICVDTVFGLPASTQVTPRKIFSDIKDFSYKGQAFGSITAHAFFNQYRKTDTLPQRKVERLVGANSVFNLRPFQKNIGCGSYRIIKDLATDRRWFSLWPFEKTEKQFTIAEGYPSYFWRTQFGTSKRDLKLLQEKYKHLQITTLDQADSFVLAFGAMKSTHLLNQIKLNSETRREGWILGVPNE